MRGKSIWFYLFVAWIVLTTAWVIYSVNDKRNATAKNRARIAEVAHLVKEIQASRFQACIHTNTTLTNLIRLSVGNRHLNKKQTKTLNKFYALSNPDNCRTQVKPKKTK